MKTKLEELLGDVSVLVVLVPALVFLMAFAFQLGYFWYYNIPIDLITIRTQDVAAVAILALIAILVICFFDFVIFKIISRFCFEHYLRGSELWYRQYFTYSLFVFYCPLVLLLAIIGAPKIVFWIMLAVPLIFVIDFFIQHILFLKKRKKQKEEKERTTTINNQHLGLSSITELFFGTRIILAFLFVLALFFFAIGFGDLSARKQRTFYRIEGRTDVVGITINNGYIITKQIEDKELKRTGVVLLSELDYVENYENTEFQELAKTLNDSKYVLLRL